ncbi:hypothetical protein L7F22_006413 [Adiantum nelumboides]|nr:hypothetical protein [Adiantum nelumboides]
MAALPRAKRPRRSAHEPDFGQAMDLGSHPSSSLSSLSSSSHRNGNDVNGYGHTNGSITGGTAVGSTSANPMLQHHSTLVPGPSINGASYRNGASASKQSSVREVIAGKEREVFVVDSTSPPSSTNQHQQHAWNNSDSAAGLANPYATATGSTVPKGKRKAGASPLATKPTSGQTQTALQKRRRYDAASNYPPAGSGNVWQGGGVLRHQNAKDGRHQDKSAVVLHRLGLIHTDLKPENILLVNHDYDSVPLTRRANSKRKRVLKESEIRLIDFGSATFQDEYHSMVVSTRHYRAPEIILQMGWTFPCDAWSIGCILVEFFTGEALFQTHDNLEHLAMMEAVLGVMPDDYRRKAETYLPAYFKHGRLDYPNKDTQKQSKKYVKAMKSLDVSVAFRLVLKTLGC